MDLQSQGVALAYAPPRVALWQDDFDLHFISGLHYVARNGGKNSVLMHPNDTGTISCAGLAKVCGTESFWYEALRCAAETTTCNAKSHNVRKPVA